MKIKDTKTEIIKGKTNNGEDIFLTYRDMVSFVVNQIPTGGLTVTDMRCRIDIQKAMDKDGEVTTQNFNIIKDCLKNMKWAVSHKDIISFSDYIDSLPIT